MKILCKALFAALALGSSARALETNAVIGHATLKRDILIRDEGRGALPVARRGETYRCIRTTDDGYLLACRDTAGTPRVAFLKFSDQWGHATARSAAFDPTLAEGTVVIATSSDLTPTDLPLREGDTFPVVVGDDGNYVVPYRLRDLELQVEIAKADVDFEPLPKPEPPPSEPPKAAPVEPVEETAPAVAPAAAPTAATPEAPAEAPATPTPEPKPEPTPAKPEKPVEPAAPAPAQAEPAAPAPPAEPQPAQPAPDEKPAPGVEVALAEPQAPVAAPAQPAPEPAQPAAAPIDFDALEQDNPEGPLMVAYNKPGVITIQPWGDHARPFIGDDGLLHVAFESARHKKVFVTASLGKTCELTAEGSFSVDVINLNGAAVQTALALMPGGQFYESLPTALRVGPKPQTVEFKLNSNTFKSQKSDWLNKDALPLPTKTAAFMIIVYTRRSGEVIFDNLRFDKTPPGN